MPKCGKCPHLPRRPCHANVHRCFSIIFNHTHTHTFIHTTNTTLIHKRVLLNEPIQPTHTIRILSLIHTHTHTHTHRALTSYILSPHLSSPLFLCSFPRPPPSPPQHPSGVGRIHLCVGVHCEHPPTKISNQKILDFHTSYN